MNQGEIWYARLDPTEGSEQSGTRPILIISGNAWNRHSKLVIACSITSSVKNREGCIVLKKNDTHNLKEDSEILVFQIRSLSKMRLLNYVGFVSQHIMDHVIFHLNEFLEL